MSNTYRLLTAQANTLPATYGFTITATQPGYTPLTVNLTVTVAGTQQIGDTVRTLIELLTVIWRDGQAARQLTTQDCRDTIVSLALQRGDFSRLPRSTAGLPPGRIWLDATGVPRVNI